MTDRTCAADGCEAPHSSKGLCRIHYARQDYALNRDARKAQQAVYRAERAQVNRDRAAAWRAANPTRATEASRRYYAQNRERAQAARRVYREQNGDLIRALNNKRKALIREVNVNDLTGQQWRAIKTEWGQRCAYCGETPPLLTMDHVVPLSRGGDHTVSNVVPACMPCNLTKRAKPAPPFVCPPERWASAA